MVSWGAGGDEIVILGGMNNAGLTDDISVLNTTTMQIKSVA